jgi:hypothetical protein
MIKTEQKLMTWRKTIQRINATQSWFFEKINKVDKILGILIKRRKEEIKINKIRGEKGDITVNNKEIYRIVRE